MSYFQRWIISFTHAYIHIQINFTENGHETKHSPSSKSSACACGKTEGKGWVRRGEKEYYSRKTFLWFKSINDCIE